MGGCLRVRPVFYARNQDIDADFYCARESLNDLQRRFLVGSVGSLRSIGVGYNGIAGWRGTACDMVLLSTKEARISSAPLSPISTRQDYRVIVQMVRVAVLSSTAARIAVSSSREAAASPNEPP